MGVARAGPHGNQKWEGREPPQELHLNAMTSEQGTGWESSGSVGNCVFKSRNQWLSTLVMSSNSLKKKMTSIYIGGIKSNRRQSLSERMALWEYQC